MKDSRKTIKPDKKSDPATLKKGFTCLKCGYEAYKLAALSHCPLCIVCKGCNSKVSKCRCREGE
ncbi:MAG: hypothetical protein AABX05_04530 [Nanoarchaeota archaeon]